MSHTRAGADSMDRRALMKVAAGGLVVGGILGAAPSSESRVEAAFVPNNFRATVHVTTQEAIPFALSSLHTIAENYSKATGRLIIDGNAVTSLSDQGFLDQLKNAKDAGAEIAAASDALQINGIDPASLPDYIDWSLPGIIAVLEADTKGYHYFKP